MVMIENYFDHLGDDKALAPFLLWILTDASLTAH